MNKMALFYQKHGLTPLKKCDFGDFQKILFFIVKKIFFLYKVIKYFFLTKSKKKFLFYLEYY